MKTRSQEVASDVNALLRSRNCLLWIVTREEARVERYLFEAAAAANYVARTWDVGQGVCKMTGDRETWGTPDLGDTLNTINARTQGGADRGVWILRDAPAWLEGLPGAQPLRQLRNLARKLPTVSKNSAQAIVILTPSANVPADLAGHATVIEWPLPDRAEIEGILDAAIDVLPDELRETAAPNGVRDAAIDAAVGLTGEEAQSCYAKSLVQLRRIDPAAVSQEKRRVIAREKVIEWFEPLAGGIEAVGGLDQLKAWLAQRKLAYSAAAREYGLPSPKGMFLVGPPGTGKSLTAKAVATAWGVPLLKLDLGALKSKFVGDSEANIRKAFSVIESVGRCVVFLDEIEKALGGATDGSADGGVSADALGSILNWMSDRRGEAFIVATANDPTKLPAELLRKGRFDECWFLDLPTRTDRADILCATLAAHGRADLADNGVDSLAIAEVTEGFTGSEIAALVPEAMFTAFSDNEREIATADLLAVAKRTVPLSKSAAEKIAKMRDWAKTLARPASRPEAEVVVKSNARALDL